MVRKQANAVGISLPIEMLARIDSERGDIPRSKYLQRIVERFFEEGKKK